MNGLFGGAEEGEYLEEGAPPNLCYNRKDTAGKGIYSYNDDVVLINDRFCYLVSELNDVWYNSERKMVYKDGGKPRFQYVGYLPMIGYVALQNKNFGVKRLYLLDTQKYIVENNMRHPVFKLTG